MKEVDIMPRQTGYTIANEFKQDEKYIGVEIVVISKVLDGRNVEVLVTQGQQKGNTIETSFNELTPCMTYSWNNGDNGLPDTALKNLKRRKG